MQSRKSSKGGEPNDCGATLSLTAKRIEPSSVVTRDSGVSPGKEKLLNWPAKREHLKR